MTPLPYSGKPGTFVIKFLPSNRSYHIVDVFNYRPTYRTLTYYEALTIHQELGEAYPPLSKAYPPNSSSTSMAMRGAVYSPVYQLNLPLIDLQFTDNPAENRVILEAYLNLTKRIPVNFKVLKVTPYAIG